MEIEAECVEDYLEDVVAMSTDFRVVESTTVESAPEPQATDDSCPVCLENYAQEKLKRFSLPDCTHTVCTRCLARMDRCPLCRVEVHDSIALDDDDSDSRY